MKIVPAVDIRGGRCVRLFQGDYGRETVYADDPVAQARAFAAEGARFLHVVDLDGAREGRPVNLEPVRRMAALASIEVEFGGGLRSPEDLERLDAAGVRRFVLGSSLVRHPAFGRTALERYGPERVVAGVDVRGNRLALQGWTEAADLPLEDFLRRLEAEGFRHVVLTSVERDGALAGPDLALLRRVLDLCGLSVTLAGGFGRLEDVAAVADLKNPRVEGIILGKALYEGRIRLVEAFRAAGEV